MTPREKRVAYMTKIGYVKLTPLERVAKLQKALDYLSRASLSDSPNNIKINFQKYFINSF